MRMVHSPTVRRSRSLGGFQWSDDFKLKCEVVSEWVPPIRDSLTLETCSANTRHEYECKAQSMSTSSKV